MAPWLADAFNVAMCLINMDVMVKCRDHIFCGASNKKLLRNSNFFTSCCCVFQNTHKSNVQYFVTKYIQVGKMKIPRKYRKKGEKKYLYSR